MSENPKPWQFRDREGRIRTFPGEPLIVLDSKRVLVLDGQRLGIGVDYLAELWAEWSECAQERRITDKQ